MLVGQPGDKKVTPMPPPTTAPAATSCCNSDPCGGDGWGHRLRNQMGGLFHRNNCNSCQPTCCDNQQQQRAPLFHNNNSGCDNCGRQKLFSHGCQQNNCQQPTCQQPTCTSSCGGGGFNLLSNLRHRFSRNDC